MTAHLITEELRYFLKKEEFLYVATCHSHGYPNVAPKFLIKIDEDFIYLVDFVDGRTLENLKNNPRVSLSIVNREDIKGYVFNGSAKIIESGADFDEVLKELDKREMYFSVERVIEGVEHEKKHGYFELAFPRPLVVIKVEVEEIVDIAPSGKLKRTKKKN